MLKLNDLLPVACCLLPVACCLLPVACCPARNSKGRRATARAGAQQQGPARNSKGRRAKAREANVLRLKIRTQKQGAKVKSNLLLLPLGLNPQRQRLLFFILVLLQIRTSNCCS
jgi:hypothetical protein